MPFGLSNALATFQEFINEVLKDLIATGLVLVYLNDILITTPHVTTFPPFHPDPYYIHDRSVL